MSHDTNHVQPSKSGHPIDIDLEDALKAVGFTPSEIDDGAPDGVVIFKYTRAQAIEDGVLVDISSESKTRDLVKEAGYRVNVAMTASAFHDAVLAGTTITDGGEFIFPSGQSLKGRLWDVLMVLRTLIRFMPQGDDRVHFSVQVDEKGDGNHQTVKLWAHIGPGDSGEAVLTIMLEGED